MQRTSGILLHPTALPGQWPLGDLGVQAFQFVDFLVKAGQGVWQILPLGPTGFGHSPYNALSAFAGNPALIDLTQLVDVGDLDRASINQAITIAQDVGFSACHELKQALLTRAAQAFFRGGTKDRQVRFEGFCRDQATWLADFCLFMAIKEARSGQAWTQWPEGLRKRREPVLEAWREQLAEAGDTYRYQQFVFFEQWQALKEYANAQGILIFGDIPFFVAFDSADVWANQHLFQLNEEGRATAVAGVPPDYFSKTGQRWGNPLYRWKAHQDEGFDWWTRRFDHQLHSCDLIRIDHFRGFQACWSIPSSEQTAINGHWEEVPGRQLFETLQRIRPELPIIAEDLGVITPEVEALRDDFGLPGMKVLQFAFDSGPDNPYLPRNHVANSVVYTGTHDNDTTLGWWNGLSVPQKKRILTELGLQHAEMPWDMIRLAMASVADLCIIPCQDILALDTAARFNTPGSATNNWRWQVPAGRLTEQLAEKLHELAEEFHRHTAAKA